MGTCLGSSTSWNWQGLPLKSWGYCSGAVPTFLPNSSSSFMLDLYARAWSTVCISGGGAHLLLRCLTELNQRLSVLLMILHLLPHLTLFLYAVRRPLFLFYILLASPTRESTA